MQCSWSVAAVDSDLPRSHVIPISVCRQEQPKEVCHKPLCKMTASRPQRLQGLKKLVSTFPRLKGSLFICGISGEWMVNTVFSAPVDQDHTRHDTVYLRSLFWTDTDISSEHLVVFWLVLSIIMRSVWKPQACLETERGGPYGLLDSSTTCERDVKIVSAAGNSSGVLWVWTRMTLVSHQLYLWRLTLVLDLLCYINAHEAVKVYW